MTLQHITAEWLVSLKKEQATSLNRIEWPSQWQASKSHRYEELNWTWIKKLSFVCVIGHSLFYSYCMFLYHCPSVCLQIKVWADVVTVRQAEKNINPPDYQTGNEAGQGVQGETGQSSLCPKCGAQAPTVDQLGINPLSQLNICQINASRH